MTFKELYEEQRRKSTPAQDFIAEAARVTHKAKCTVKMWLVGRHAPDELAKTMLANHYGCKPEELFPEAKTK